MVSHLNTKKNVGGRILFVMHYGKVERVTGGTGKKYYVPVFLMPFWKYTKNIYTTVVSTVFQVYGALYNNKI